MAHGDGIRAQRGRPVRKRADQHRTKPDGREMSHMVDVRISHHLRRMQPLDVTVCAFEDSTRASRLLDCSQGAAIAMKTPTIAETTKDNDVRKGATEDERPASGQSSHPGLDNNGL